ncbi:unnamed protein product [Cuscuta campestris]|uniref:Uncharacterized protein n=1 Tax=Cuscuta campestris TaxID=132261 RepID=A0A484KV56_9ASTE|nr:unnamed protein product [Cuscuta campestris]
MSRTSYRCLTWFWSPAELKAAYPSMGGVFGDDPKLRHLGARSGVVNVGGHDEVHDEEDVRQAWLGGEGGAIRHVNHDELCLIDGGTVDDFMNRLQILVEEQGVTAVARAENPGEDVEKKALLRRGRVDCRCAAVADEVGDPKLSNDDRLVVEGPIVASVRRDGVSSDGQSCDPCKSRKINLYVVEIDVAVNGVAIAAEIGVECPDKGGIVGRATLGDEGPQTRRLELVVELVIPLLLGEQFWEHSGRRDWVFGEVREEPVEFLFRPELEKGSVKGWQDPIDGKMATRKRGRSQGCLPSDVWILPSMGTWLLESAETTRVSLVVSLFLTSPKATGGGMVSPSYSPLAGLRWNDHLLNHEFTEPATTPDLEESLEKLLCGDPYTGMKYHYRSWVWWINRGGEGTSQAHKVEGRGVSFPRNTTEVEGHCHSDTEFKEFNVPVGEDVGAAGSSQAATSSKNILVVAPIEE